MKTHLIANGRVLCGAMTTRITRNGLTPTCKACQNGGNPPKGEGRGSDADWQHGCEVCGEKPTVAATGMCGPCTFGEAETVGGNW